MKIGLDCRLGGLAHAGIGRYIENLALRLPKQAPEHHFVYFFRDQSQLDQSPELSKLIKESKNVEVVWAPIQHYSVAEQITLPGIFKSANLDLLHVPHFNAPVLYDGPLVITIHDLLWHENQGFKVTTLPPWIYLFKYLGYKFVASQAIQKAQNILVPAETVKKTLSSYYPAATEKIKVTKEGIGEAFLKSKPVSKTKDAKTLVYVGSLYPHKNIEVVLQTLTQLPDYKLILVGSRNIFQDQVKDRVNELQIQSQVEFAGYLSDQKLIKVLQSSAALIQPSLSEGFGLTGLEAMATGTPVLASDIPIFREVYGEAAIFFNPRSALELEKAINKLQTKRESFTKAGLKRIKEYSWEKMTQKTIDSYQNLKNNST